MDDVPVGTKGALRVSQPIAALAVIHIQTDQTRVEIPVQCT
ncbi:hypothetical protein [Serratia fonticola]